MGNSIGNNLETQIILDTSGVRTGAQRGVEAMQLFETGAERLGDSLSDIGSRSSAMTASLERAAGMIELMTAKMLASDKVATSSTRSAMTDRISAWQAWMAEQAGFLAEMHKQVEQDRARQMAALSADIQERLNLQQRYRSQWAAEEAGFLSRVATEAERERSQEMAALRRDIEERLNLQQRYRSQWAAEQVAADQRDAQTAERARTEELAALREDIIARANAEAAADRDAQMRAEQRARSAYRAEQRVRADAARFSAGANRQDHFLTTPDTISPNFRSIARDAAEWERARQSLQHAEQSVRNMQAMTNPLVAMEARLANEAAEFADHMQRALRAGIVQENVAEQLTAEFRQQQALLMMNVQMQQQGYLGMRRMGFAAQQFGYAIEDAAMMWGTMGWGGAFRAGANNLTAMAAMAGGVFGVGASLLSAAVAIGFSLWEAKIKAAKDEEDKLKKKREELLEVQKRLINSEQTLYGLRRASSGNDVMAVVSGQMDAAKEAEANNREFQRQWRRSALEAKLNWVVEQQKLSGGATWGQSQRDLDLEKERVQLQEQLNKLLNEEHRLNVLMNSADQKFAERARERELALQRSVELRDAAIAKTLEPERRDTQFSLMQEMHKLETERLRLKNAVYETEVDLINAMTEHGTILDKQVAVAERMAALRKEGLEAEKAAKEMILGRFEGVNEELKFTNDQTRARKELNEQIQKGLEAGTMSVEQAEKLREENERILQIENTNRNAEKRIAALRKQETALEELMSGRSREATVMGSTAKGTDEAARIIEQERLRVRQQNDTKPMLDELKGIRKAIERQETILERNANERPDPVAALF